MAVASRSTKRPDEAPQPSETGRSLVSLFLVIHLFCVLVAFGALVAPSPLQARLLAVLRPYVRILNLELPYAGYHLTRGTPVDVDNRIEILLAGANEQDPDAWVVLPDAGFRGSDRYKRYQRLAKRLATINEAANVTSIPELEAAVATIAKGTAAHVLHQQATPPTKIRCRQHFLQNIEAIAGGNEDEQNPNSDVYFRVPYAADVLVDGKNVDVSKIRQQSEVARPDSGGND